VEYQIQGINQVQVNTKTGLTFAAALRSILRQDPDVVLVGEMRDLETTEIAFHAAMTGHLVLSTLHTNSAIATLARLLDLGVDPTLINSAITLIIAQRLVRKLCKECKRPYDPPAWMLERLVVDEKDECVFYEAVGCPKCGGTGYAGRLAVLEFLPMTKNLREMIANRQPEVELKNALRKQGMKFLLDRGREIAQKGNTDLNELFRVLQLDAEEEDAGSRCPHCNAVIEAGFTICPSCMSHLTFFCQQCRQELKKEWNVCPYCKTSVGEAPLQLPAAAPLSLAAAEVEANTVSFDLADSSPAPPEPARNLGRSKQRQSPEGKHAEGASTAVKSPVAAQTAPPKKPAILIVDDDASIRAIVRKALEQLPFPIETHIAADGAEALQIVERVHPDLLVLDVMMPGMDGFEVCAKLRSQVKTAFIPVMMLTANSNEQGRIKGYLVGADDYVAKPFSVPELNARVTRLLRRAYGLS
jgi:CheY-like chemotaxis protein